MKYIHNITFLVDPTVKNTWREWMVNNVFPEYTSMDSIDSYKLSKILNTPQQDGVSYSLHLEFESAEYWAHYKRELQPKLEKILYTYFKESVLTFATSMQILEQG